MSGVQREGVQEAKACRTGYWVLGRDMAAAAEKGKSKGAQGRTAGSSGG